MKTIRKAQTIFNYRLPELCDVVPGAKFLAVPAFRGIDPEADPKGFSAVVELSDPVIEPVLGNDFVSYRFLKAVQGLGRPGTSSILLEQFLGKADSPVAFWIEVNPN